MRRGLVAVVLALHIAILLAPWIAPHSPIHQYRNDAGASPSSTFLLGTDDLGRDVASRMLYGARVSVAAGALATVIAVALGLVVGGTGGGLGRRVGALCSILTESTLAVPWMFLLLAIRSALPLDLPPATAWLLVAVVVGTVGWGGTARLARGVVRQVLAEPYVLAARAAGATPVRVLVTHAIPALGPVLRSQALVLFPQFVLAEVGLSFLGLGTAEPWPSLGTLLGEARALQVLSDQPWRLAPAGVLVLLIAAYQSVTTRGPRRQVTRAIRPLKPLVRPLAAG